MMQIARPGGTPSEDSQPQAAFTIPEKFELLSAYMDDEITEQEKQLVEQWLASDVQMQRQHQAQLKLRLAMRTLSSDLFSNSDATSPAAQSPPKHHLYSQGDSSYEYSGPGAYLAWEPLRGAVFF